MPTLPYRFARALAAGLVLVLTACPDEERTLDPDAGAGRDVDHASDLANTPDAGTRADATTRDLAGDPDADSRPDLGDVDLGALQPISLRATIDRVQPMTGIVLWEDSWDGDAVKSSGAIALEYAYVRPSTIVTGPDTYDWSGFDAFLDRIAARSHQAVVRFYYTYPGEPTAVPDYIKALADYQETQGQSEGQATWFPDWSNAELQRAHLAFYAAFADRYDADPRVAFLQVGFGLWGEYHIYDGPNEIGEQFPSKAFQAQFFRHLDTVFDELHWSISIDAGDPYYSPFSTDAPLLALPFGNFDDSFMHADHGDYNESMWEFFGYTTRYATSPHGGELSYYTDFDQEHALDPAGIHGRTYEELSAKFHISYMIGNDQPAYQSVARIRQAGMANGYRFRVVRFDASDRHAVVTIANEGVAPIYYDAFVAVNGVRAAESLRGLLPGEQLTSVVGWGGETPTLSIEADRLVPGQTIDFAADL